MITATSPIGFFDSGVGGTSIWKEMIQLLPHENTIYLADSAHAPYGHRSQEEIIALSDKNTKLLLEKGAKIIVVACNTATTNAIDYLRATYAIPFIGIEPAIKPAALQTQTKSIGVLATAGTLSSALFAQTSEKFASDVKVIERVGEGLVPLIENAKMQSEEMHELLTKYLNPMLKEHIDYLILGCTHYPYLIPQIKAIVGKDVEIIDSGFAVSKQIKAVLNQEGLLNTQKEKGKYQFFINADPNPLQYLLKDVQLDYEVSQIEF